MLTFIVVLAVLFIVGVLILASLRPDHFRVERFATIQAPPEKVFLYVNDLRNWAAWSTWDKMDPDMKKTYSTVSIGKGATYEWEGDRKVGHGRMTITESEVPSRVLIALDFLSPMRAHNTAEFTLAAQDNGTMITWAMYGPATFLSRVISVFCSMERMVSKEFDASLANLKTIVEKQ